MEKKLQNSKRLIAVSGPESTGKTTLSQQLAEHFEGFWIPEYARSYLSSRNGKYTEQDVIHIAEMQIKIENKAIKENYGFVFCDTDLLVCKIWLEVVWNKSPEWIDRELISKRYAHHLLLYPDLKWEYDPLREYPDTEDRKELFRLYSQTLHAFKCPFTVIKGLENKRFELAVKTIESQI